MQTAYYYQPPVYISPEQGGNMIEIELKDAGGVLSGVEWSFCYIGRKYPQPLPGNAPIKKMVISLSSQENFRIQARRNNGGRWKAETFFHSIELSDLAQLPGMGGTVSPGRYIAYITSEKSSRYRNGIGARVSRLCRENIDTVNSNGESTSSKSPTQKLEELKIMLEKGLITEEEYSAQKRVVLKSL